ncbi:alpha/beta hydrolase [Paenibacillus sp. YN15]|uniref:alpha/beta hydrolase n=1 Tax=Paenibacillus sp. YN15 TaxID=1742774 RepID=UPI000DCE4184|nr:alpha/beta hydrolase-fold protein [Paenibacillus sp. YN15]RAV02676.1 alpha/beta hydrolase [Paenibacillus sp. YN15]
MRGSLVTKWFEDRNLYIYTPPSYAEDESVYYPAVYVQDGSYLFADSMEELEADFARGVTQEVVFVGIEPVERTREYTPWKATPLQPNENLAGEGDAYLTFVTENVMPYVKEQYRILEDASRAGIAGGSFGALISLYAAYRKPAHFGRFALMSASLWYEQMMEFVESSSFAQEEIRLYMYVGEQEGVKMANLLKHMVPNTKKAYALLKDKVPGGAGSIMLETDPDGVHSHHYFNRYFPHAMKFLYPGAKFE